MVKVTFKPWQEIVIHEAIEYKIKDLIKSRITGLKEGSVTLPLLWAEGVLFNRSVMPPTDDVIRDQLQGIIHFSAIEWALMPKFKSVMRSEGVSNPVINVDNNESLKEVARQLKAKHKKGAV